jgi:hypothetical protein
MPAPIDELYHLSSNEPLFRALQKGGALTAPGKLPGAEPAGPQGRAGPLLASVRAALVPSLEKNEHSDLHKLADESDTCARVVIFGELVLALHALAEDPHTGAAVGALQEAALRLAMKVATALEANPPVDSGDDDLIEHATAMREWAHHYALYYRARGMPGHEAEMFVIRARATNTTLCDWPYLVGPGMLDAARGFEAVGRPEVAAQYCQAVRTDLRYFLSRPEKEDAVYEVAAGLYWLERACAERLRLAPDDADAKKDLEAVRRRRRAPLYPDPVSEPRFGPIARTYLPDSAHLALVLNDLIGRGFRNVTPETVAAVCSRHGCESGRVAFYASAIESYLSQAAHPGVHMMGDSAHMRVFGALNYMRLHGQL